jgi:hypothetical protein
MLIGGDFNLVRYKWTKVMDCLIKNDLISSMQVEIQRLLEINLSNNCFIHWLVAKKILSCPQ